MIRLQYMLRNDYDKKAKVGDNDRFCYSQKQLDNLYPDGKYTIVGETLRNPKKKSDKDSKKKKPDPEAIGKLALNPSEIDVYDNGTFKGIAYKKVGYFAVEKDKYVCLFENRMPFLFLLIGMIAALIAILLLIYFLLINPILHPQSNPLPPEDPNTLIPDQDDTEKVESENGGGSLSMIYTLEAKMSLSTGDIGIYFINPNASNHDVVVELVVISGENEYLIAKSGRIPAGKGITKLTFESKEITLQEGKYSAVYRLACYDPKTGDRALVMPEITDVVLTVEN